MLTSGSLFDEAIFIGNELYSERRPAYVFQPNTVADIASALTMAKTRDLPFSIKCGGHSYAGYCLNDGGLMLDLSLMQGIEIDEASMTVRADCGVRWLSVYEALAKVNPGYIVMGGICPGVGISGAVLGGGINLMSRTFGLAIDSLQAVTMMTAGGELLELSGSDDLDDDLKDLWWAIRGGGGGNFGVVVSFTLGIFDVGPLVIGALHWDDLAIFEEAISVVNAGLPRDTAVDAVWVKAAPGASTAGSMTVSHLGSVQGCEAGLGAIFSTRLAPSHSSLAPQVFAEWDESNRVWDPFAHGTFFYHVGFIFGPGAITPDVVATISELMAAAPSRSTFHWNHVGGACSDVEPDATAYHWRAGEFVATAKIYWYDGSDTDACMEWAQQVKDALTPFALKGQATYINYIENPFDGWQEAYYGENYARLRRVKSRFDPENFFRFPLGIEPSSIPSSSVSATTTEAARSVMTERSSTEQHDQQPATARFRRGKTLGCD
ncbi:MAG: FAD-binding oxidoreductase [Actinobacteria bacterium]|nr:FAD-binding oxidoreductase [Actinomycetota bacterium]